jgi:hypothetical protein
VRERYANVTDEFEIWNEPHTDPANYAPYAKLAAVTCQALHRAKKGVPVGQRPRIFYGTLSSDSGSAAAFVNFTLPMVARYLQELGKTKDTALVPAAIAASAARHTESAPPLAKHASPMLTLADCVTAVTYHGYGVPPERNHAKIVNSTECGR